MPNHHKGIYGSIPVVALILLTACSGGSGGSSSDDAESASGEEQSADEGSSSPPELTLDTSSRPHAVHLAWTGADTVDIYFSTDPECDWDAYGSCPDSGLITNVEGQESLLSAPEDGLLINRAHWFVVAAGDRISDPMPGRPWVPTPNDEVTDLILHENVLYAGGDFDALAAPVGGIALFNDEHHLSGHMPWSSDTVYGVASDGHGGYFYFGDFEWFMGEPRINIAHVDEYGRLTDWTLDVDDRIEEVLVVEDTVYVAGRFTEVNGNTARQYLAAVDRVDANLKTGWRVFFGDRVEALAAEGDRLFVAGRFDEVNTEPNPHLVAVNRHTGDIDETWSVELDDRPRAMLLLEDRLIIGGGFKEINSAPWANLAAIDLDSGAQIENWGARPDGSVRTMAIVEDRLYIGGSFEKVNGHPGFPYLAALNLTDGSLDYSWRPEPPARVDALLARGDQIYAGFQSATPEGEYIRLYDTDTAEFDPDLSFGLDDGIESLSEVRGAIAIAGDFEWALPLQDTRLIVALDAATGKKLSGWQTPLIEINEDPATTLHRLAIAGDHLYLAAQFDSVNGHDLEWLVRLDRLTGEPDLSWQVSINDRIRDMSIAHQRLYIGGSFDSLNGESVNGLAAVDLNTGATYGEWQPELYNEGSQNPRVDRIHTSGEAYYIVGRFDEVDGDEHPGLAALDSKAKPLTGFSAPEIISNRIHALLQTGDLLIIGGSFVEVDGEERLRLAAIDASTGELQLWRHDLQPESTNYQGSRSASALLYEGDALYVGGRFEGTDNSDQNHLIALTAATGDWVDWVPPDIQELPRIRALQADGDWIYVAGEIERIAGYPGRNLVVFSNASQGSEASILW